MSVQTTLFGAILDEKILWQTLWEGERGFQFNVTMTFFGKISFETPTSQPYYVVVVASFAQFGIQLIHSFVAATIQLFIC